MKMNYRVKKVANVLDISVSTVWRWTKASREKIKKAHLNNNDIPPNLFPLSKKLSTGITVWSAEEIEKWNSNRVI